MSIPFASKIQEQTWAHPEVARAQQEGDHEKATELITRLPRFLDGRLDTRKFQLVDEFEATNINTLEGKREALDLITGISSNTSKTWYLAPFESNSTPALAWDGDFGAGTVTEFIRYTGTDPAGGRQACNFTAATGAVARVETTNTTRATFTVDAGVVAVPVYGVCISDNSTFQYGGGASVLLAAVRYPAFKTYNAAEVKYIGYMIYVP